MNKKYYTVQEIQTMKFYELPNIIYATILSELEKLFHVMTPSLIAILNKVNVCELDQYVNIYKYITVM